MAVAKTDFFLSMQHRFSIDKPQRYFLTQIRVMIGFILNRRFLTVTGQQTGFRRECEHLLVNGLQQLGAAAAR